MVRRPFIAAALLAWSATGQAAWQRATSKHFVVYSDDTPDHVRDFTTRLEKFDKAMRVWHVTPEDVRGASARVTIFVVGNVAEVQKVYGKGGGGVAGFYHPQAGDSVAFTPRSSGEGADYGMTSQAILFHEYTHHWMLTNWADAAFPPWFVEGFAELHATAMFRGGDVVFGAPPTYRSYTVGNANLLPASQLLRPDPGHLDGNNRDALYSRGWLLTDYLIFDPERRSQFTAYVAAINAGKPAGEASRLLGSPDTLDLKMNAYGRQRALPSERIPASDLAVGTIEVKALAPAEAAIMPAFILSKRGVTSKTAATVVALTRRLAAPYPTDTFVQNELAEAEYDACATDAKAPAVCFAASEAASDRALAVDPKSVHAMVYKGMAEAAAARRDKITDPARWAAIRKLFLTANRTDTEAPQPLVEFYESFAKAGQVPTANAEGGLLYAYALAPYDAGLRIDAARVFLHQDKPAQARTALAPVAYNLDEATTAARAQKVIAALEGGGSKAALAELDRKDDKKDASKSDAAARRVE